MDTSRVMILCKYEKVTPQKIRGNFSDRLQGVGVTIGDEWFEELSVEFEGMLG
jgi:hypothetical protein